MPASQRLLQIDINGLSAPVLLTHASGQENLSDPFSYKLTVLVDPHEVTLADLLGRTVYFSITHAEQSQGFHGVIEHVIKQPVDYDGLQAIELVVSSWFGLLAHTSDCQIYQDLAIPDIIAAVFKAHDCRDFDTSLLQANYDPLPYCVQYNESALNFVSRLLESAGITYYFEHDKDKHTMVLTDSGFASKRYPEDLVYLNATHSAAHLHHWERTVMLGSNGAATQAYLFNTDRLAKASVGDVKKQQFQYPSELPLSQPRHLQQAVKVMMKRHSVSRQTIVAHGNYLNLSPGYFFYLSSHDSDSEVGDYQITESSFTAKDITQRPHHSGDDEVAQTFEHQFKCVSFQQAFVPQKRAKKSVIGGLQSATVVGPPGEEVYTDVYGRVKCHFPWDHHHKPSAGSSCWIRVAQQWAGDQYGMPFVPRIGQEVLVSFENGDPDCPFILGVAPNSDDLPPFTPDKTPAQSGFKSHSLKTVGAEHGNMLRFDDNPATAGICMQAEKDFIEEAGGDYTKKVGGNLAQTVKAGDWLSTVGGEVDIKAGKEIRISCGNSEIVINNSGVAMQGDQVVCETGVLPNAIALEKDVAVSVSSIIAKLTPNKKKSLCSLVAFSVSCSHGGRGFVLDVVNGRPTSLFQYVLQVIATDKTPDKIKIQFSSSCGGCKINPKRPMYQVFGPNLNKTYRSNAVIDVYSSADGETTHGFVEFFEHIIIPDRTPVNYEIIPSDCANSLPAALIEVFPAVEWAGKVTVGYQHDTHKDSNFNQNQGYKKLKVHGKWVFEGELSVKRNEKTWRLGGSTSKDSQHYKNNQLHEKLFKNLQGFLDKVVPHIGSIKSDLMDIKFDWPCLSLSGSAKNVELPDKYNVDNQYNIELGMNPLFGICANAKILNWLIAAVPTFGAFILKIKDHLEKGVGNKKVNMEAEINVNFIADATIGGKVSWSKIPGKDSKCQGSVEGKIDLKLKAIAEGRLKVFIIKVAGAIIANGDTSVSATLIAEKESDGSPSLAAKLGFGGLTIYWSAYYEVGAQSIRSAVCKPGPKKAHKDSKGKIKEEFKHKHVIFQPASWPSERKKLPLQGDSL